TAFLVNQFQHVVLTGPYSNIVDEGLNALAPAGTDCYALSAIEMVGLMLRIAAAADNQLPGVIEGTSEEPMNLFSASATRAPRTQGGGSRQEWLAALAAAEPGRIAGPDHTSEAEDFTTVDRLANAVAACGIQ